MFNVEIFTRQGKHTILNNCKQAKYFKIIQENNNNLEMQQIASNTSWNNN